MQSTVSDPDRFMNFMCIISHATKIPQNFFESGGNFLVVLCSFVLVDDDDDDVFIALPPPPCDIDSNVYGLGLCRY